MEILIDFGATKLNLKIVEVPIRYAAREYGETQISRFGMDFAAPNECAYRKLKIMTKLDSYSEVWRTNPSLEQSTTHFIKDSCPCPPGPTKLVGNR